MKDTSKSVNEKDCCRGLEEDCMCKSEIELAMKEGCCRVPDDTRQARYRIVPGCGGNCCNQ